MIKRSTVVQSALVIAGLVAWVGCGKKDDGGQPSPGGSFNGTVSSAVQAEADSVFANNCAACHGAGGKGNGPGSSALNPKPRNFTLADWQEKVTDERIGQVIRYGGASVGLSPAMPAHPEFLDKPELVAGLIHHIRSLKGK